MKMLQKDLKHGMIKIRVEAPDDLWYLEGIIEPSDIVGGMTERKIKMGGADEKSKISRINVFLKIKVEKISFEEMLRVSGPIIEGPEDVPRGEYHTFGIEEGTVISIEKDHWTKYVLKKLDDGTKQTTFHVLVVAFDREEAIFALLKNNGYDILLEIKGDVAKKEQSDEKKTSFYKEIITKMKDYDNKYLFNSIVLASPAFWKEYLLKELDDEVLRKKITLASCSSIDGSTINEILKRPELKTVLEKDQSSRETTLIEELLGAISKENAAYGIADVKSKIDSGNISVLLISENLIRKMRSEKSYGQIDSMMEQAETLNAEIRIISSEDAARKLDGLSGIACLLRWKENY